MALSLWGGNDVFGSDPFAGFPGFALSNMLTRDDTQLIRRAMNIDVREVRGCFCAVTHDMPQCDCLSSHSACVLICS